MTTPFQVKRFSQQTDLVDGQKAPLSGILFKTIKAHCTIVYLDCKSSRRDEQSETVSTGKGVHFFQNGRPLDHVQQIECRSIKTALE